MVFPILQWEKLLDFSIPQTQLQNQALLMCATEPSKAFMQMQAWSERVATNVHLNHVASYLMTWKCWLIHRFPFSSCSDDTRGRFSPYGASKKGAPMYFSISLRA
jgi:hypothetical protein